MSQISSQAGPSQPLILDGLDLGVAMWVWSGKLASWPLSLPKNVGRTKILISFACKDLAHITCNPHGLACDPHKKNLHLCMLVTFLLDFYINVTNSCMSGKKCYVFLNVLKFEEYIMYVKVQIRI